MKSIKMLVISMILFVLLVGCKTNTNISSSSMNNSNDNESSQSSEDISSSIQVSNDKISFDTPYKIYINPSVQYQNLYFNNNGNEGIHMNEIAVILYEMLTEKTNLDVTCNCAIKGLSLSKSVQESNSLNADYHFAIHSNAGGGSGSEVWVSSKKDSQEFGKTLLDNLNNILPYTTRGVKYGDGRDSSLYEIKNIKATVALIEILFHDDEAQSLFIINNKKAIAEMFYKSIVTYLS